jgi:hypothetical protein
MIELEPKNRLPYGRGNVMDGVATKLRGEAIRGPMVPAAASRLVGTGQNSTDLPSKVLVLLVRERLEQHPHFRGRTSLLAIELVEGTIVLSGRLPSHYLKQLLQEAIRRMPGVVNIDNQVDVVWPNVP